MPVLPRRWRLALAAVPVALVAAAAPGSAGATADLGDGVGYRSFSRGTSRVFVAEVRLAAASTPSAVLAGDRLGVVETTSSMAQRSRALVAVNGDFGLSSGRPVHAFATGGRLVQTEQLPGRGVASARSGDRAVLGFPVVDAAVVDGGRRVAVTRWNSGAPAGDEVAGFTAQGAAAPGSACYAALAPTGPPRVDADGRAATPSVVQVQRCSVTPPAVPAGGSVLAARAGSAGAAALPAAGRAVVLATSLGTTGGWSLIGASEQLVAGGRVDRADVDQPGAYVQDPAPRTAAALTGDGRLLLVVVDGRQPGWSTGMSLRQLARLLVDLGARSAVNLDGGGSSAMWVRGTLVNRPSDGRERAVSSALVVLPGAAAAPAPAPAGLPLPGVAALRDPASTGGLLAGLAPARPALVADLLAGRGPA